MNIKRAYKTELKPNRAQNDMLRNHCGAARFACNRGLARKVESCKLTGKSPTAVDLYFVCLESIFHTRFLGALDELERETDQARRWMMRWEATRAFFPEMITILQLVKESLRDEDVEHRGKAAGILRWSLIEPLAGDLEKGIKVGMFRGVNVEVVPFALISVLETFAYRSMLDGRLSDADIEQALLDFILHGLVE